MHPGEYHRKVKGLSDKSSFSAQAAEGYGYGLPINATGLFGCQKGDCLGYFFGCHHPA